MKRVSVSTAVVSALCLSVVACASDPPAASAPPASGNLTSDEAGTGPGVAPTDQPLDAACDAAFDAMLARTAKCGAGTTMHLVAVERSRPSFKKLCRVQGSRPGTGYTVAYRAKCAETLATASCNDDDAIVKACWEPRGELARGLPCNTDDQCKDGLCELPPGAAPGTSCGVCGTPVWKEAIDRCDKTEKDKCEPGTVCDSYYHLCRLVLQTADLGEPCGAGGVTCRFDLACEGPAYRCVKGPARAAVGEACGPLMADRHCELGALCNRSRSCALLPGLDEAAGDTEDEDDRCDSWTTESATGKCIVKEALACN
jgi:hypothetical protein